jgi:hypothetical protein
MKIPSRPPAMAGAVVPAQLYSGRPRESGDPSCRKLRPLEYGSPPSRETTPGGCQPLSPLAPLSRLSISILRLIFAFRFVFTFVSSSPSSPAPLSHRGPLSFALPPSNEGRRSAGAGHWHSRRACEARHSPPVRREGASRRSTWRFWPRDRRFIFRQCPPESAPRLRPRPGTNARPIGSAPPAAAVRSAAPGRHSPLRPQGATGGARTSEVMRNVAMMRYVVK